MGAPNSANVSVGKPQAAGGIWFGPLTATTPTDPFSELVGFTGGGYVSEDGLVNGIEADTENIVAWGGDTVLTVKTSHTETFQFTFIETTADVLKQIYGPENVIVNMETGVLEVRHTAKDLPRVQYVFEILLTGNKVKRIVIPNGQVTEIGEISYVDGETIGYQPTLSAYPDESGVTAYEYIATTVEESGE